MRSYRLPRLIEELARHDAQANRSAFLKQLAKVDLLYIDDFGLAPLADQSKRDLLEILEDRYDKKSTLITSQLPVDQCMPTSMSQRSRTPSSIASCITAIVSC